VITQILTEETLLDLSIIILTYVLLFTTTGAVRVLVYRFVDYEINIPSSFEPRDPHAFIGKLENYLVLTLILVDAYSAVAAVLIVKGALQYRQSFNERDQIVALLGTLVSFAYSLTLGLILKLYLVLSGSPLVT